MQHFWTVFHWYELSDNLTLHIYAECFSHPSADAAISIILVSFEDVSIVQRKKIVYDLILTS